MTGNSLLPRAAWEKVPDRADEGTVTGETRMTLIKETDFGTPKSKSAAMVTLEIDGLSVTVPEGTSIMRAAMELGTKIPKLCATDSSELLRLLPPVPRRDRRPQGNASFLHHAGCARHQGAY